VVAVVVWVRKGSTSGIPYYYYIVLFCLLVEYRSCLAARRCVSAFCARDHVIVSSDKNQLLACEIEEVGTSAAPLTRNDPCAT